ncbi:ABC transporter permease [Demequina soli]|uniref:ABC transporter permease n=1 Tax=Demequina soli TaxID=1638987 RepID=UPI0007804FDE|nr:ABC transporter permease [Demequina soli]
MTATAITPGYSRALPRRVPFRQTVRDSLVMARRSLVKMRRTPEQLIDVTVQPIIFTVMFTYIFGGAIAGDVASYLPAFIPGILAQTVLTGASAAGTTLREDMDKGVFDRFASLPIARIAPLAGALLGDVVRYLIATTITFAMGFAMGWRPEGGLVGVAGAALLIIAVAWALSWIFALVGVTAKSARGVQGISFLILFPLTFLSNAFVPVDTMPGWLQGFVSVNPVSHVITAARDLCNAGTFGADGWLALLGAVVAVAIFAPLTVSKYRRHAR